MDSTSRGSPSVNPQGLSSLFVVYSAELQGPGKLVRIRPEIFDFELELGLKLGHSKPKISGTVPTNWHTTIPNDSGPIGPKTHSMLHNNASEQEIGLPGRISAGF